MPDVNVSQEITVLNQTDSVITFDGIFSSFIFCKYFKEWWICFLVFLTRCLYDNTIPTCNNINERQNGIWKHNFPILKQKCRIDLAGNRLAMVAKQEQKRYIVENMQEYNKQNKKVARIAKRALGKGKDNTDGRDELKEHFNKDKNRPNTLDIVTIKEWKDMIRARTQLFLNNEKYEIFRDLFEKYKTKYNVKPTIRLSENAFKNLKTGNKHVMNNPAWHNEMRNFCKIETDRLNKMIKEKSNKKKDTK